MNRKQRRAAAKSRRRPGTGAGAGATVVVRPANAAAAGRLQTALSLHQSGRPAEAKPIYQEILAADPDNPDALNAMSVLLLDQGDPRAAVACIERLLAAHPDIPEAYNHLCIAHQALGDAEAAVAAGRRAAALRPGHVDAYINLGNALLRQMSLDEAETAFRKALAIDPRYAGAHNNLAAVCTARGDEAGAVDCMREALALSPGSAHAYLHLGNALYVARRPKEAAEEFRRAIAIEPGFAAAHNMLGSSLRRLGRLEEAAAAYRVAIGRDPNYVDAHTNLIFMLSQLPGTRPADYLAECRAWDARHAAPRRARARPHGNSRDPDRRLRIGYVSPDFRTHTVAYFMEPLIANHDSAAVEVFCYAELARPDETSARFRAHADHWRVTSGMDDHAVADRIREDGIDILVDLAGHTLNNRLLVFAERPAPVQACHLVGHGQTKGMAAIDHVLTDRWLTPAESDFCYSETPVRLDRCLLSFEPSTDWPAVTPPPAATRGHVSFACFANSTRITPPVMALWARVLEAVPDSRLLLMNANFRDPETAKAYRAAFAGLGVAGRVEIRDLARGWPAEMEVYEEVDILLDTWPLNGGSATCIGLWMGLPVVTLVGETGDARYGYDFVSAVGLDQCVAFDEAAYVARAAALAGDPLGLARLRAGMRERMRGSPLMDHAGLARAIEAAYREMWRRWCG